MIELTTDAFASVDEAPAAARELRRDFRGLVHLPGDYRYDAHRVTWSGRIDPYPAMVAEATTPSDVRVAVADGARARPPLRRPEHRPRHARARRRRRCC